jgi:organic radical activating enzyme
MSKIKVAELFYSLQGEGRYMGVPSIFLRTFGCNFRCQGFGCSRGKLSEEYLTVNPELYTQYDELPLVGTGCDSYASWDPRFKNLSPMMESSAIADKITDLLPLNGWTDEHLVITGGEPLLGWQRAYPDLLDDPQMEGLRELTFETNGTQMLTEDFKDYLIMWANGRNRGGYNNGVTFSVSAKLSCSGEAYEDAIKPEVVLQYQEVGYTYLKFVVATKDDVEEALRVKDVYRHAGFRGPIFLMPVGGVESVYSLNNKTVAELAMKYGLRYSDRLQVPLFKNAWGT